MRKAERQFPTQRAAARKRILVRTACAARLLPLLLLALPAVMQAQIFTYTTNNGAITITGYSGWPPTNDLYIPSMINGLPVTSIGSSAFYNYALFGSISQISVTIPSSVTNIGDHAFYSFTNLAWIAIPNSVISIGGSAFQGCSLSRAEIPNSVTSIGSSAFSSCASLLAISVGALNLFFCSADGVLFNKNQTWLIQYPGGKVGNYTIPNSVTNIGSAAFSSCSSLTNVTIPISVTSIGSSAFYFCSKLTSVTIPNGVTSIGNSVFSRCTNLTSFTIPTSVANIGEYAFSSCTSLTNVTIPTSVTNIGRYAFSYCTSLANATIPTSITSIGSSAFSGCTSLTSVTIPVSVASIGDSVFSSCTKLTSVTIPASVTNIGSEAFYSCRSLTNVTIPKSVTSIGSAAFSSCASLTLIIVDALNLFYSSVDGVLFDKSNTTLIQCPGGKAGAYMVPSRVTNIGTAAFRDCTNLTSITIPDSVTSINVKAFVRSTSLTGLYFQGNAPSVGSSFGADNATVYYLPGTTGWGATYGGRPTALWKPLVQTGDASFGVRTNQFGFNIAWASGQVVVEACADLAHPVWSPLQTNTLSGDSLYFSDPQWTNYPSRFYRIRSP